MEIGSETIKKLLQERAATGGDPGPRKPKPPVDGRDCQTCGNWGYIEEGNIACPDCLDYSRRQQRHNRVAVLNGVSSWSKSALESTFGNYKAYDDGTKTALAVARAWASEAPPMFAYLWGKPGNGKTHLCAAAANMKRDSGVPTVFITAPELAGWLRAGYDDDAKGNGGTFEARIQNVILADALVIDDLGAERRTDWWDEQLFRIIDSRYRDRRKTLIASNLQPDQLPDPRIVSRFRDKEVCAVFQIQSQDYRRLSRKERETL